MGIRRAAWDAIKLWWLWDVWDRVRFHLSRRQWHQSFEKL